MELQAFHEMAALEDKHWWFVGRRHILNKIVNSLPLPPKGNILEVGCGTGGNLDFLSKHGNLQAIETDPSAREYANQRKIVSVKHGHLPGSLPFKNQQFDLIAMFDVLEHIEEDKISLQSIAKNLNQNGKILITVPAFQWLWSRHDEVLGHKRRYRKSEIVRLIKGAGLKVDYSTYFNVLFFPLIVTIRLINKIFKRRSETDVALSPKFLNRLFMKIFSSERVFLPNVSYPFGLSILVVSSKN